MGLFDEQFRATREDQYLAHRARQVGIGFLHNEEVTCLHNDKTCELARFCRFRRRGAHDTARLCAKYPDVRGGSPLIWANRYLTLRDSPVRWAKKLAKRLLSTNAARAMLFRLVAIRERGQLAERALRRLYRLLVGLIIFRGWRDGLGTFRRGQAG